MNRPPGLRILHLLVLAALAALDLWQVPALAPAVMVVLAAALLAEWRGAIWQQETLITLGLLIGLSMLPAEVDWSQHYLGLAVATWILIPSRPGLLRAVSLLILLETIRHPLTSWQLGASAGLLILCLHGDSWYRISLQTAPGLVLNRQRRPRIWSPLLAIPLGLLLVTGLHHWLITTLNQATANTTALDASKTTRPDGPLALDLELELGNPIWTSQDPTPTALLLPESATSIARPSYLQAVAIPELNLHQGRIHWQGAASASRPLPERIILHEQDHGVEQRLVRWRGGGEVVPRPAGAAWIELRSCLADIDGNCYQPGIDLANTVYPVAGSQAAYPADQAAALRATQLPRQLLLQLEQELGELLQQLRRTSPGDAAVLCCDWLQNRCRYSQTPPPPPDDQIASELLQFLVGPAEQRHGHCQYFSTALVVLLRAAGFAARPVVGYLSNESYQAGVLFRALHAHAWAEVLDSDSRWLRVDPTPAAAMQADRAAIASTATAIDPASDLAQLQPVQTWRPWLIALLLVPLLLVLLWRPRQTAPGPPLSGHLRLARDSILDQAVALGIEVGPGTSITTAVQGIESVTGVDLQHELHAYHRARFAADPNAFASWPPLPTTKSEPPSSANKPGHDLV